MGKNIDTDCVLDPKPKLLFIYIDYKRSEEPFLEPQN